MVLITPYSSIACYSLQSVWPWRLQVASSFFSMGSAGGMVAKLPLVPNPMPSLCFKLGLHCLLLPVWAPPTPSILLPKIFLQHTSNAIPLTQTLHGSHCPEDITHNFLCGSQVPWRSTSLLLLLPLCPRLPELSGAWTSRQAFHMLFSLPVILSISAWITSSRSSFLILQA